MHQSLLNQFRGAYLGAVLGDVLASGRSSLDQETALPLGAIALSHTQALIGQDPDFGAVSRWIGQSLASDTLIQLTFGVSGAIFFHDDLLELQRYLAAQRPQWCPKLAAESMEIVRAVEEGVLILAIVMSGILQQCFQPLTAIATVRQMLETLGRSPELMDSYLSCLEAMLAERQPLAIATIMVHQLESPEPSAVPALKTVAQTVAIALYAALSSLEHPSLALQRIQMLQSADHQSPPIFKDFRRFAGLMTGMIVGAYNGLEGIPLAWRYSLTPAAHHSHQGVPPDYLGTYWNVVSEVDVLQWVDQLFARWAGADQCSYFFTSMPTLAIASPPTYGRLRHPPKQA
ncbi:MAG: hypothetical protein IGR76_12060 [Synechococcales cyanobacterium T60_A2020_003]|nr:hypothetical protein [Synechococcales cyanobacterium T60_A2020_003]